MEIKEGMYVRTNQGIGTIHKVDGLQIYIKFKKGHIKKWVNIIGKPSYNIIDLIEKGDYVNGSIVTKVSNKSLGTYIEINYGENRKGIYNEDIKSVVTQEQFENMKYEVQND